VHGAVQGNFAARLPWIAAHVGVSIGRLGLALLMPGIGAMLAMPFSGRLVHRNGFRPLVAVTMTLYCLSLMLPAWPTSLWVLCLVLLPTGAVAGVSDMVMNAQAVLVERHYGASIMSSAHGFWSVGVLAGSGASALASRTGLDTRVQFAIAGVVLAAVAVIASRAVLPDDDATDAGAEEPPAFALPSRPVLLIGLVGLCAVFGEQAGMDWSAVYLRHQLHASLSLAALGVSATSLAMAVTRLVGDRVIRRYGPVTTVRLSAVCAAAGAVTIVAAPWTGLALVGFALLGVGVATVVPLVFAAAGRVGPHPGRSIAGVAGIAYGSGLITPGVIGGIASATSLSVAYGVFAVLATVMGLSAVVLRPAARA
jgi:predicted MFS family arabinose efflux permease